MRWLSLAVPALLAILLGLAINLASNKMPGEIQRFAWPVLIVLAIVSVLYECVRRRATSAGPAPDDRNLLEAAEALANAVERQWSGEAEVRGLLEPKLLPQPWATTEREVLPPIVDIVGQGTVGGRPRRLKLRGGLDELTATFLALPSRQLIVLGEPGTGKSVLAMRITLALLAERAARGAIPVPVLLSVGSWRVGEEPLHDWLTRRLREDYPALVNTERYGPDAASRLVTGGLIFPILDGIDELPPDLHGEALELIDRRARRDTPLIMTCRGDEYQAAVTKAGMVPATALVVELGPVRQSDAVAYLSAGKVDNDPRWATVFAQLRRQPPGPLAQALSTPLMVGLVRAAYSGAQSDPAELLTFTDGKRIEQHLLDRFLAAVYPSSEQPRADTWLRFLARHLRQQNSYELAWWHLHRALPATRTRKITGFGVGLVAAVISTVAVWLMVAPTVAGPGTALPLGLAAGVTAGLVIGLLVAGAAGTAVNPSRINTRVRGRRRQLGRQLRMGLWKGSIAGLLIGVVAEVSYTVAFDDSDPASLGLLLGLGFGTVTALAYELANWLEMPVDSMRATDPATTLRADRTAKVVRLAVIGLAFGIALGLATGLVAGPVIGLLDGTGAGLIGVAVGLARGPQVWSRFVLTRCRLAMRGDLPWRLMAFLEDAHRRGVLRVNGGYYKFRHGLLQDHLAGGVPVPADDAEPAPTRGPRARSTRVRHLAVLSVIALVAGMSLGVGLPIAGGLQTRCGVSPFDTDVRYLRAGLQSECVGVTDGSYAFIPDPVYDLIRAENESVHRAFETNKIPYVRVALLAPLTAGRTGIWSPNEIRRAIEGAYIAQLQANRTQPGPNIELLLANEGSQQHHWKPVVTQLIALSKQEHPLVAVVGLGVSTTGAREGAQALSANRIPMVAAMLNGVGMTAGDIPGMVRISPDNQEYVKALMHSSKLAGSTLLVSTDRPDDLYTVSLRNNFKMVFGARFPLTEYRYDDGTTAPASPHVASLVCTLKPSAIMFSGRVRDLHNLVAALKSRSCQGLPLTIGTEAMDLSSLEPQLHGTGIRLVYAAPIDIANWTKGTVGTPPGFGPFESKYHETFNDPLDDGSAILHHDAVTVAAAAIRLAASKTQPEPDPAAVANALENLTGPQAVAAATGTLSFGSDGNPGGKPIPIIELPRQDSNEPPYTTAEILN
ncbi:MAG: NACHT domain-containing protein [Kibdelosporangium sp.]